jgi:hypothetical protein
LIKTGEKKLLQTLAWEDEKQRILTRAHKHMEGHGKKANPTGSILAVKDLRENRRPNMSFWSW